MGARPQQGKKKSEEDLALEAEQLIAAQKSAELKAQGNIEEAEKVAAVLEEPASSRGELEKDQSKREKDKQTEESGPEPAEPDDERELLKQAEVREKERKEEAQTEKAEKKVEKK